MRSRVGQIDTALLQQQKHDEKMKSGKRSSLALRVSVYFLLLACLWILLYDWLVHSAVGEPFVISAVDLLRYAGFVLGSTALVFFLIAGETRAWRAMRAKLNVTEDNYRRLVESAPLAIALLDREGTVRYANSAAAKMVRAPSADVVIGHPILEFVNPNQHAQVKQWIHQLIEQDAVLIRETLAFRRLNGESGMAEFSALLFMFDGERLIHLLAADISEKVRAQDALRQSEKLYEALTELSPVGIYRADAKGKCTYVNERWCEIAGLSREQALGDGWTAALHPEDRPTVLERWSTTVKKRANSLEVYRFLRADGTIRWVYGLDRPEFDEKKRLVGFIGTVTDITERKTAEAAQAHAEEEIERLAYYDPLTGLPNRALLSDALNRAVRNAKEAQRWASLLIVEVYRFSDVNHALGYDYGDRLLKDVAARIQRTLSGDQIAARLGASVFAILTPDLQDQDEAVRLARALIEQVETSTMLGEIPMDIKLCAGLALYPRHADRAEVLFRRAETAKAASKRSRPELVIYSPAHEVDPANLALIAELRHALEARELIVDYQPKISLKSGQVTDVEALVRWEHPQKGLIPPADFIPAAERTGLISQITRYVLSVALVDAARWRTAGLNLFVCVNMSARDLYEPEFVPWVQSAVKRHQGSPSQLTLELTESMVMEEPEHSIDLLRQLSEMGVQVSVDDFGTGYSSLAYLKRLPIDELKIDGSFVKTMVKNKDDALIVTSTIRLAHELGLRVTAEGVEDAVTYEELKRQGCDKAQGFGIARPMSAAALQEWALARIPKPKR